MLFADMEFFVRVVMVAGFAIPHRMANPLTAYPSARSDHLTFREKSFCLAVTILFS